MVYWDDDEIESWQKAYVEYLRDNPMTDGEYKNLILGNYELSGRIVDLQNLWLDYYKTTWNMDNGESLVAYRRVQNSLKHSGYTPREIRDAQQWAIGQIPESWG